MEEKISQLSQPTAGQYAEAELKKKFIVLEGQNEYLKEKNDQLAQQYNQLKNTHEMAVKETAELRQKFQEAENQIDDLQDQAAATKASQQQAVVHQATIGALEAKIEALEMDLQVQN